MKVVKNFLKFCGQAFQKNINYVLVEIPNITSSPGVIPTAVWFEEPSKIPKIGKSALKMRESSNSDLFFIQILKD